MTFDFLKYISLRIYERYQTLEKNIKSLSNSFYDSYIDLQEELTRYIIFDFDIEIKSRRSLGELLRIVEVRDILINTLNLNEHTYNKLLDYNQKINAHKHSGEKKIELEIVLKYITIFYDYSSTYARYKGIEPQPLDIDYFIEIFGALEKENQELKGQIEEYRELVIQSNLDKEEKERYLLLLSYAEISNQSLEEQNRELRSRLDELSTLKSHIDSRFDQIDRRLSRIESKSGGKGEPRTLTIAEQILKSSEKSLFYLDTEKNLIAWKGLVIIIALASIIINIITSYFSTKWFELYSTFTLFENLWMILQLCIMIYAIKATQIYDLDKYMKNTMERFYCDSYGVPRKQGTKGKYKALFVLSIIGSLSHIFLGIVDQTMNMKYLAPMLAFEILSLIMAFVLFFVAREFFSRYCVMLHTVCNKDGVEETFVDDNITGKLIPFDEYLKIFDVNE